MQIIKPEPFTFKGHKQRAVLLLHGFTGHSADVRMLARHLNKAGYTTHAPIYRGHGETPEDILKYGPDDWWIDAREAFDYVKGLGHEKVAVVGLSLGGTLSLKLAATEKVLGVVPMCTPMFADNQRELTAGFMQFAKEYKQAQQKQADLIQREIQALFEQASLLFGEIAELISQVKGRLPQIDTPIDVVQARLDEMINIDSAPYIYEHVSSVRKGLSWYEKSGHAITFGPERHQLHEDIYEFLEGLDW